MATTDWTTENMADSMLFVAETKAGATREKLLDELVQIGNRHPAVPRADLEFCATLVLRLMTDVIFAERCRIRRALAVLGEPDALKAFDLLGLRLQREGA